jgi:hypothetical protein
MSKNSNESEETTNKGGRYPEYTAKFFTMQGNRPDELEILKMEFGSEGVDFYVSVFETLCTSNHFIYPFKDKYNLQLLAKKKDFDKDRFLEILKFCVEERALFDRQLYEKGYIFSSSFLNTFDNAGLFRNRTMTADDVRNKVKELLGEANQPLSEASQPLTELNPKPGSVEAPILNNTITDNSKEEKDDRIKKEKISKGETDVYNTRESLKEKSEPPKIDFTPDMDEDLPF